ncbi:TPA: hypothetical protein ACNV29_001635 [Klebsiella oxytoca]
MTTDITELAQREKFEAWAEERCALPWGYLKNRRTNTGYFSKHDYTSLWAAWKAAGAELVEALEKAQAENTAGVAGMAESYETTMSMLRSRIAELDRINSELDSLTQRWAVERAENAERIAELEESNAQVIQSRDHYKRMTDEGLKRLAESRTVTVKLPDYRDTYKSPFADEVEHQVRLALELFSSAAGIKVGAE